MNFTTQQSAALRAMLALRCVNFSRIASKELALNYTQAFCLRCARCVRCVWLETPAPPVKKWMILLEQN